MSLGTMWNEDPVRSMLVWRSANGRLDGLFPMILDLWAVLGCLQAGLYLKIQWYGTRISRRCICRMVGLRFVPVSLNADGWWLTAEKHMRWQALGALRATQN